MDKNKITSENYENEEVEAKSKVRHDKETKKKSNAQKAMPWLIVSIVSLVVILTCVLIAYYQVNKTSTQNKRVLEGVYASSYYSMVDNVNNMSVDLAKYSTMSTTQSKLSTINDISNDCNYVLSGLSVLPIDEENVTSATKFFNQVNGVCEAYSRQLSKGEKLSQEQEVLFDKIAMVLSRIKEKLNKQNASMYDTNYNFIDATIFDNTGMNELSASMGDLTNSEIEYPAMIFDGPFSTALETKEVKGLPMTEISKEQAENYLKNTVYKNRDDVKILFEKETNGDISTFDFKINVEGKHFFAQISKRGGLLITLSGYAEGGDAIINAEQAREMAKTFANNIGFENMDYVWEETHENVAYINLVSKQNDVLLYPDMIKVKVDMTAQDIIGFEALNYAFNHVTREIEFVINETKAEESLGFDYQVLSSNRALIRLDSGKEVCVYEFITERIDGMYFYYIDAMTGEIAKTMKLVEVKGVEKLI